MIIIEIINTLQEMQTEQQELLLNYLYQIADIKFLIIMMLFLIDLL
jgi:hypothetical protein